MKALLLEVVSKLPNKLELPRNPNTKQKDEVYKVHNLPMPLHHVITCNYVVFL